MHSKIPSRDTANEDIKFLIILIVEGITEAETAKTTDILATLKNKVKDFKNGEVNNKEVSKLAKQAQDREVNPSKPKMTEREEVRSAHIYSQ